MTETSAAAIIGILTLFTNYTILQLVFPRRFNNLLSIILPILYTAVFYTILLSTGTMSTFLGGFRGFVHLPLILLLIEGPFFIKVYFTIMQMLNVGFLLVIAKATALVFAAEGTEELYTIYIILVLIFFVVYAIIAGKLYKRLAAKLFLNGNSPEWVFYSLGALFSFTVFAITFETVTNTLPYILLMVSSLWSFVVLCFAIINTHEKSKQRYEAELARSIVSSGREHYQRMDEMYSKLRLLRHDYKYHLTTIGELLAADNRAEVDRYLNDIQQQFSKIEMQPFCSNTVVNALLTGYAERCGKMGVEYIFEIILPEPPPVPNYEMCIVLGNLLENALEACKRKQGGKKIQVLLKPVGEQLALRVRNSYDGRLNIADGKIKSTKGSGGFGLKSVEAVAAQYGGELLTDWNDDMFTAYVSVKL